MQYALTSEGKKVKAFPGGRAICPGCGGVMIAKCGPLKDDHWSHESLQNCDSWLYEPITQWHLNWQNRFPIEEREVTIKKYGECHRADIHTHDGTTIEVQNSIISVDDINDREHFYDKLVWVINTEDFKHRLILRNYQVDVSKIWRVYLHRYNTGDREYGVIIPPDDIFGGIEQALIKNNYQKDGDEDDVVWFNLRKNYKDDIAPDILAAFENYMLDVQLVHNLDDTKQYGTNFKWKNVRKPWFEAKQRFLDLNNGFMFYIKTLHENGNGFGLILSRSCFLKRYRRKQ